MKPARLASLLILGACSSPRPQGTAEAPELHFRKAAVLAAVDPDNRREVEDLVAAEIVRRRPGVEAVSIWKPFPDLADVTEQGLVEHLHRNEFDLLVTIVAFPESAAARHAELSDVVPAELGGYVAGLDEPAPSGRFGVQVVAWDVRTKKPVFARTSEILADAIAAPRDVIDFSAATVARER